MTTLWIASLQTRNFDFESYDFTPDGARRNLNHALQRHCRQSNLDYPNFMDWYEEDIQVTPRLIGGAYRDRQPI